MLGRKASARRQGPGVRLHRRGAQPDLRDGREDRPGAAAHAAGAAGRHPADRRRHQPLHRPADAAIDPVSVDPPLPTSAPGSSTTTTRRAPLSTARKRELVPRWMDRPLGRLQAQQGGEPRRHPPHHPGRAGQRPEPGAPRPAAQRRGRRQRAGQAARGHPRGLQRRSRRCPASSYVRFTRSIGLPSADFWDLHHLLEPGYKRWQARLSTSCVKILPAKSAAPVRSAGCAQPAAL